MDETVKMAIEQEVPLLSEDESPFLCGFCDDIHSTALQGVGAQQELDMCRSCVRIDSSVRFADFLLIQ